jgi:hypothetical protein
MGSRRSRVRIDVEELAGLIRQAGKEEDGEVGAASGAGEEPDG